MEIKTKLNSHVNEFKRKNPVNMTVKSPSFLPLKYCLSSYRWITKFHAPVTY